MTGGWQHLAACRSEDPELFFAEEWDPPGLDAAKAVCARCPVVEACLAAATELGDRYGVRGGLSEAERAWDWLLLAPEPGHVPSRGRYSAGCRCRGCEAENTAYVQAWRQRERLPVTPARTVDPCEQLALDVMSA